MRRTLEYLFALLLRHATKDAELFALSLELLEVVKTMEDLLLGLVANRAGVVEDEIGRLDCVHLSIALLHKCADDFFGVMHVHLAPKGLQVKRFLRDGHHVQYSVSEAETLGETTKDTKEH